MNADVTYTDSRGVEMIRCGACNGNGGRIVTTTSFLRDGRWVACEACDGVGEWLADPDGGTEFESA